MSDNLDCNFCPICGIRYKNTETNGELIQEFWWSRNNTKTTPDAVYSKVCSLVKDERKEQCVNKKGTFVKSLTWGESMEEKLMNEKLDELFKPD